MPDHLQPAVLLGAFAALRIAEAVAPTAPDVDFIRGVITPARQHGGQPLKSPASAAPIPIPQDLALVLSSALERSGGTYLVTDAAGRPPLPGRSDGRSAQLRRLDTRSRPSCASTTCAMTSPACSSVTGWTSRSCRHGCGMPASPQRSTRTASVARCRRVRTSSRGTGPGGSCGQSADNSGLVSV